MLTRCEEGREHLHKVRGSVDVARNMVERSTGLCARSDVALDIIASLAEAADALSFVADALDAELRKHLLGPAA